MTDGSRKKLIPWFLPDLSLFEQPTTAQKWTISHKDNPNGTFAYAILVPQHIMAAPEVVVNCDVSCKGSIDRNRIQE